METKFLQLFKEKLGCENSDEVFEYLINNLKDTNAKWDYFVNWSKAENGAEYYPDLGLFDELIGKQDIQAEAAKLFEENPQLIPAVPALIAWRKPRLQILDDKNNFVYEDYDFSSESSITPMKAAEAMEKSGLLDHIQSGRITSMENFLFGVQVGLDSHGRKNRGGKAMEEIVEGFVKGICDGQPDYDYITEATAKKINATFGHAVNVDKANRRFDFAINAAGKLFLIETNFYREEGTKLKSTAGEYRVVNQYIKSDDQQFIWVTDGAGWRKTRADLRKAFDNIDYVLSLDMLQKGILEGLMQG